MSVSQPKTFSVIVPTLNEAAHLATTLANIRATLPGSEIIVADGGSTDDTPRLTVRLGARLVTGTTGRGSQLAEGAAHACSELLIFLHADTRLPTEAASVLNRYFARPEVALGTFRLAFDEAGPLLRASAWLTRFDSVFTRFGDQAIVVRRTFYDELGGFPRWPLFEDVEFLRRARRRTRVWSFPACVTTSARRFRRRGPLRQQWLNTCLLLRFLAGTPPAKLAARYRT